ncbi:MAG: MarR family winged helix-turn-helix transcriptional regulator [Leptospirales bacterium]
MIDSASNKRVNEKLSEFIPHHIAVAHHISRRILVTVLKAENIPLTPEQFVVLIHVQSLQPVSQKVLARSIGRDDSNITRTVDNLEQKGCLERTSESIDRRINKIRLKKAGKEIIGKGMPLLQDLNKSILEGFQEKEVQQFIRFLEKLNENTNKYTMAGGDEA